MPIGFAAYAVLGRVVADGPMRLSDLAARNRMLPAALTRQVQALEAEGYIERRPDPADGRAAVVEATPAGRAAYVDVDRPTTGSCPSSWPTGRPTSCGTSSTGWSG